MIEAEEKLPVRRPNKTIPSAGRKKWSKLSNVMRSVSLMKTEEVKKVKDSVSKFHNFS